MTLLYVFYLCVLCVILCVCMVFHVKQASKNNLIELLYYETCDVMAMIAVLGTKSSKNYSFKFTAVNL